MTTSVALEKQRINELLAAGKISAEEYELLLSALVKEETPLQKLGGWLFNPFERMSAPYALAAGFLITLAISLFGAQAKIYFPGAVDLQVVQEGKRLYSFLDLWIQNLIAVFLLAGVLYVAALLLKQKNLRPVDFLGAFALARFPYAVFAGFLLLLEMSAPQLIPRTVSSPEVGGLAVVAVLSIACVVWKMVLFFRAYKISSGLRSKALWLTFVGGVLVAEILSLALNYWLFKK